MANSFTNLKGSIYEAFRITSREKMGAVRSVSMHPGIKPVALGESVTYHQVPTATSTTITPSMTIPAGTDKAVVANTLTVSNAEASSFNILGEEELALSAGVGFSKLQADYIAEALRVLGNKVEAGIGSLYTKASRAYGTAGTTPFGTSVADSAQAGKILDDNGAPSVARRLVGDTAMGASLRSLGQLTKANEAGTDRTLRTGDLLDQNGFEIRESNGIQNHTQGTGTGYTSNTAGYAVGATAITLLTGSGTVLAGDVVTFAGDANKYLVTSGVAAPGVITLAAPGLRQALPASAVAMTIGASYKANLFFDRNAIQLVVRPPKIPAMGDGALSDAVITDPFSGITYRFAQYGGYHMGSSFIELVWGMDMVQPEHAGVLLG